MITRTLLDISAALMVAMAVSACSEGSESPLISGQTQAVVAGRVEAQVTSANMNQGDQIALVWIHYPTPEFPDIEIVGSPAATAPNADGSFRLIINGLPPEQPLQGSMTMLIDSQESRIAYGLVAKIRPGTDLNSVELDDILGYVEDHVVVYVESDVQPGDFAETYFDARLGKGYHLIHMDRTSSVDWCWRDLCYQSMPITEPVSFQKQVRVMLGDGLNTIFVPNYW